jgi:hypothetical protein
MDNKGRIRRQQGGGLRLRIKGGGLYDDALTARLGKAERERRAIETRVAGLLEELRSRPEHHRLLVLDKGTRQLQAAQQRLNDAAAALAEGDAAWRRDVLSCAPREVGALCPDASFTQAPQGRPRPQQRGRAGAGAAAGRHALSEAVLDAHCGNLLLLADEFAHLGERAAALRGRAAARREKISDQGGRLAYNLDRLGGIQQQAEAQGARLRGMAADARGWVHALLDGLAAHLAV